MSASSDSCSQQESPGSNCSSHSAVDGQASLMADRACACGPVVRSPPPAFAKVKIWHHSCPIGWPHDSSIFHLQGSLVGSLHWSPHARICCFHLYSGSQSAPPLLPSWGPFLALVSLGMPTWPVPLCSLGPSCPKAWGEKWPERSVLRPPPLAIMAGSRGAWKGTSLKWEEVIINMCMEPFGGGEASSASTRPWSSVDTVKRRR